MIIRGEISLHPTLRAYLTPLPGKEDAAAQPRPSFQDNPWGWLSWVSFAMEGAVEKRE